MKAWVDSEQVALLLNVTPQTVRKSVREGKLKGKYEEGAGRGGKTLKISIESLPAEVQIEYYKQNRETDLTPKEDIANYSAKARREAQQKKDILDAWKLYLREHKGSKVQITNEFVEAWNATEHEIQISKATLYRWDKEYRQKGLAGLCPDYKSRRKGRMKIDPAAWVYFKNLYLDQSKKSIALCHKSLELVADETGWTIPSLRQMQRLVKEKIPEPVLAYYRDGLKAYTDKYEPYIIRDYSTIVPNQLWVSDHNQLDLAVQGPNGTPVFPWVTIWMDARARKMVGWVLTFNPNQDSILASFRRGILKYGVPEEILIDNGKDYRSKAFAGGRDHKITVEVDENEVKSLIAHLDIVPHFAIPYNAKSKHIERAFRTNREWFSSWFESYRGPNIMQRPERLQKVLNNPDKLMTLDELAELYDRYIEHWYNTHSHSGMGMDGHSPDEVYHGLLKKKRTTTEESLKLLMMKTSHPRKVQRNGIRLFDRWFWNEEISMIQGQEVYVRYDQQELGRVYVFDLQDRFICVAEAKDLMAWGATQEDYRDAMREKKRVKRITKSFKELNEEIVAEPDDIRRVLDRKEAINEANQVKRSDNIVQLVQTPFTEAVAAIQEARQGKKKKEETREEFRKQNPDLFEEKEEDNEPSAVKLMERIMEMQGGR